MTAVVSVAQKNEVSLQLQAQPAVTVAELSKAFKGVPALQGVSLTVRQGEMVALVGASGWGKSTLLRTLNGLQPADNGEVKIFDTPLQSNGRLHSKARQLRSQVGFIFQQFNLVNRLSVIDNVLLGHLSQTSSFRSAFRLFIL